MKSSDMICVILWIIIIWIGGAVCNEGVYDETNDHNHRLTVTIVIALFFLSLWILLFMVGFGKYLFCSHPSEIEQQLCLVMCSPRNYRHQYIILFRIGCASDDFDWNNSNIDIELLGPNKTLVAPMVRFSASRLIDPVDSYMKIIMGRIVPIPKIESIQISHTGLKNTKIFLFWLKVFELSQKGENEIQFLKVFDYVESKQKFLMEHKNTPVVYPEMPTPTLTLNEVLFIIFTSTSLIAFNAQLFLSCFSSISKLWAILLTILFSSIITLSFETIYIFVFKHFLKKSVYKEKCMQTKNAKWTTILCITNLTSVLIIGCTLQILTCLLVWIQTLIESHEICWIVVVFVSMAIVFGFWFISSKIKLSKSSKKTVGVKEEEKSQSSKLDDDSRSTISTTIRTGKE